MALSCFILSINLTTPTNHNQQSLFKHFQVNIFQVRDKYFILNMKKQLFSCFELLRAVFFFTNISYSSIFNLKNFKYEVKIIQKKNVKTIFFKFLTLTGLFFIIFFFTNINY